MSIQKNMDKILDVDKEEKENTRERKENRKKKRWYLRHRFYS